MNNTVKFCVGYIQTVNTEKLKRHPSDFPGIMLDNRLTADWTFVF